jgi:hypothetical protein
MPDETSPQSSIILYQTEDGRTRIQCRFENDSIWLTAGAHFRAISSHRADRERTPERHLHRGRTGGGGNYSEIPNSSI